MNSILDCLQPYPFERLRGLLAGVEPSKAHAPLNLSIGEPRHPTPAVIREAITAHLDGLSGYPPTAGSDALREAIAGWLMRRYGLPSIDPKTQVLPVLGSREALFAFAQTVVDPRDGGWVVCPNPFYQIYEGAALLAGAQPWFVDQVPENGFRCDWDSVPQAVWSRTRLLYVCSPGNPTGAVMSLDEWRRVFELSDRHGFVIAADECYSEIYFDEAAPPIGALQAAQALGRGDFARLVVFSSLSKRSNAPGMRSGFVAGDATILKRFLLYRTYHGSAMSPTFQAASIAAWNDEAHVRDNRAKYREKFDAVTPVVASVLDTGLPEAGFYLWARVPGGDDQAFCRELLRQYNVLTLPGSFLAREHEGRNPGAGFVRLALVEPLDRCVEAAGRIRTFLSS
ncbi:succinyldiaminopimelate transaminase [Burkholderiaceae bacterium FT117]|uniref:succinyldiaminopimelate transaminase n=1 Tax=Zeimonas sediminis TaxID=2944268 RepID=UPI002342EFE3|nr:succinyldiaminopimelate transaminase [Zeimonas sediminis]MCM5569176.1 succinyldiaminopimelate transaminase [Zeimonas sediminis]